MRAPAYPAPGADTVILVTDTHFGRRDWTSRQLQSVGLDVDFLERFVRGVALGGDQIHWRENNAPEDAEWNAWFSARRKGVPWVIAAGNHDLNCFTAPYTSRTAQQWMTATNLNLQNQTGDMSATRVLSLSPDEWIRTSAGEGPMSLSTATMDWLDAQLMSDPRPTWIVSHVPLPEQYTGHMDSSTASRLSSIIGSRGNVVGWMSGHRHANIRTDNNHAKQIIVGGKRLAGINGPPAGGQVRGTTLDPWDSPLHAMLLTYNKGSVECRWRNLVTRMWDTHQGSRTLTIEIDA